MLGPGRQITLNSCPSTDTPLFPSTYLKAQQKRWPPEPRLANFPGRKELIDD